MIAQLTAVLTAAAALSADQGLSRPRIEQLLADGDTDIVMAVFRRHAEEVLPFVDQFLEGGLKLAEEGGDPAETMRQFRLGIRLAKLADEAIPGAAFGEYAANFASWTAAEQARFRTGQTLYRQGRELVKSNPGKAAEHFEQSATIARDLGDLWGAAMAYTALAQARRDAGHMDKVDEAARQANEINPKLRQRRATIVALIAWGDAQADQQSRGFGSPSYQYAWSLLKDEDPRELREELAHRLADALERAGQPGAAIEFLRKAGLEKPAKAD